MNDDAALSTAHFSQEDPGEVEWMEGGYGPLKWSSLTQKQGHQNVN